MALMGRAFSQAQKFGVEIAIPDEAVKLECGNDPCHLLLGTGERIQARSVVIATGARYRRLAVDRLDEFEGSSIHYWASPLEADLCAGLDVALVGGGNSAGQATVFLASRARHVTVARAAAVERDHVAISDRTDREPSQCGSRDRLRDQPAGRVGWSAGERLLARPLVRNRKPSATRDILFSFIGAEPNTDWLQSSGLKLDERGFVVTGGDDRLPLETSRRGIFAVGDVRSGSVKRVAASVGDGAQVVAAIHQYLATPAEPPVVIEQQIQVTAAE